MNTMTLVEAHNAVKMEREQKEREKIENNRKAREDKELSIKEFSKFINKCKSYFIVESVVNLIDKSLRESNIKYSSNICRNVLYEHVNSVGSDILLKQMSEKTLFLSEMANNIYNAIDKVTESCDKCNSKTFNIKTSINTDFFDKMNMYTDDQITKALCKRVEKAENEYIEDMMKDKKVIEDTANKIKEKVDSLKTNDQTVKESYSKLYSKRIGDSVHKRPKGILEFMITNISRKSLKDEALKESFITEGKIDFDKVKETSNSIFIALEAMNTIRLKEFDKNDFINISRSLM